MGDAKTLVLGGGMSGLAAGMASGFPVLEATASPGGICSSYYVRPSTTQRLRHAPDDGGAYRFEIGGGHWIFGGDPAIVRFIRSLGEVRAYERASSVFFPDTGQYVPYPLQNHLGHLERPVAVKALAEMARPQGSCRTMEEWLRGSFGETLCDLFFFPFHDLYTAGMHREIAPQDPYKSPASLGIAIKGAFEKAPPVGYNVSYLYPVEGLDTVARKMAERGEVRYGKRVTVIDVRKKTVACEDGTEAKYERLISTLPLVTMVDLCGLQLDERSDPYTSVLVLNLGARRGARCPDDHWIYVPRSRSGFHRVGFYSNVDRCFLPKASRADGGRVSVYVERACRGGRRPPPAEVEIYTRSTVDELRDWGFIEEAEVADPTFIDVAYTWSWPDSRFRIKALKALEEQGIYQVGRYGRWVFQGIADSIRDGFYVGQALR
ncbi:MAG: protoporphyrinogen oxidase-like protein [Acidobacteria bacterium 13_1_40CM_2_68_5]|nr:MAG: protoporphyrinogen oxidase-like protein [Acidobacteria bacterium 13_1_40CM_2_68_5]